MDVNIDFFGGLGVGMLLGAMLLNSVISKRENKEIKRLKDNRTKYEGDVDSALKSYIREINNWKGKYKDCEGVLVKVQKRIEDKNKEIEHLNTIINLDDASKMDGFFKLHYYDIAKKLKSAQEQVDKLTRKNIELQVEANKKPDQLNNANKTPPRRSVDTGYTPPPHARGNHKRIKFDAFGNQLLDGE